MTEGIPRPLLIALPFVGIAGILIGLSGVANSQCDPAFSDKCHPAILLAGRALFVAVGTAFIAISGVRLLEGRRPWATIVALVAGVVECMIGAWFAFALLTGMFQPVIAAYQMWAVAVMVPIVYCGVILIAAAISDRVMRKMLD